MEMPEQQSNSPHLKDGSIDGPIGSAIGNPIERRFSVAPMMECSLCQRIVLLFKLLAHRVRTLIVLFVVPTLRARPQHPMPILNIAGRMMIGTLI
jgi:hypothetical protein